MSKAYGSGVLSLRLRVETLISVSLVTLIYPVLPFEVGTRQPLELDFATEGTGRVLLYSM
jgi:hypothetical protein